MAQAAELFNVNGLGVVVTGGASGIGLGFAEALARNGARVTLIDIDQGHLDTEVARLTGDGLDVRGAIGDVTDHALLDAAIDDAASVYDRLDVCFANAGIDPGPGFVGGWAGGGRPGSRTARSRTTPTHAGNA